MRTNLKTKLRTLNPMYYEFKMEAYPKTYIDHFNPTPRKIRCISDGSRELDYFENSDDFGLGTNIWMCDVDDFTYYLRAIVNQRLLKAGQEYELTDAYLEQDVRFGMVELKGQPELDFQEFEGFHGFPAFLFEEVRPVGIEERKKSLEAHEKRIDEEIAAEKAAEMQGRV